jgi:hypothetical protein
MCEHTPALITGHQLSPDGTPTPDWADINEVCPECLADNGNEGPGPCTQPPADSVRLAPGALVQVRPARRWRFTPVSKAVVIGCVGSDQGGPLCLICSGPSAARHSPAACSR